MLNQKQILTLLVPPQLIDHVIRLEYELLMSIMVNSYRPKFEAFIVVMFEETG